MQVLILDYDLNKNIVSYVDKHVHKLAMEITQLLCTTLRVSGYTGTDIYKLTHKNHPWSIFARERTDHFIYLFNLANGLFNEYSYRYDGRIHKSHEVLKRCFEISGYKNKQVDIHDWKFPFCIPSQYISPDDVVSSYRSFLINERSHLASWRKRDIPEWWC
jgi:hypothetical protein